MNSGLFLHPDTKEALSFSIVSSCFFPMALRRVSDIPLVNCPKARDWSNMTPEESLYEIRLFLSHVNAPNTIFRANHASNYLALKGVLNKDSEKMIHEIDEVLSKHAFKPEYLRGL